MSEQFPAAADAELILQQQNTIRSLAESRVAESPMQPGAGADSKTEDFALKAGTYVVYPDKVAAFAGGFTKFVSKEDATDTVVGLSWPHIGGNMSNPNRYIYNLGLKPNGDIVGRYSVEGGNRTEPEFVNYDLPAGSPDPDVATSYARTLSLIHDKAQEAVKPYDKTPRGGTMPAPETRRQPKQGLLSRWLGRSSLR